MDGLRRDGVRHGEATGVAAVTAADLLYGLAIVAGAVVLVAAEDLFTAWARRRRR